MHYHIYFFYYIDIHLLLPTITSKIKKITHTNNGPSPPSPQSKEFKRRYPNKRCVLGNNNERGINNVGQAVLIQKKK